MSAPGPLYGVIFDMDGVLTDSEPLINAAAVAMFRERGLTVRPEDFPVQPCIRTGFRLMPSGFFNTNPGIDLAPAVNAASCHACAAE